MTADSFLNFTLILLAAPEFKNIDSSEPAATVTVGVLVRFKSLLLAIITLYHC
jgi:hypothetical protein